MVGTHPWTHRVRSDPETETKTSVPDRGHVSGPHPPQRGHAFFSGDASECVEDVGVASSLICRETGDTRGSARPHHLSLSPCPPPSVPVSLPAPPPVPVSLPVPVSPSISSHPDQSHLRRRPHEGSGGSGRHPDQGLQGDTESAVDMCLCASTMRSSYFEDEAGRPPVAAGHLLKQDGVDAQAGGGVGGLTQQPGGQTEGQETGSGGDKGGGGVPDDIRRVDVGAADTQCRCLRLLRSSGWRPGRGSWSGTPGPSCPDRSAASGSSPGPEAARTPSPPSCKQAALAAAPPAGQEDQATTTMNQPHLDQHRRNSQKQSVKPLTASLSSNQSTASVTLPSGSAHGSRASPSDRLLTDSYRRSRARPWLGRAESSEASDSGGS